MESARACFSHIVIDCKIYVFGGISGKNDGENLHFPKISNPLAERYDPIQDKWEPFEINNSPSVAAFSWTKLGKNSNKIMILGGTNGYST
jgi:N-acetylneuraminic acid mutarotase